MQRALIDHDKAARIGVTRQVFSNLYGEDVLNYLLIHGRYDYNSGVNPVIEYDKNIMLCHDGILEEVEVTPEQGYVRNRRK